VVIGEELERGGAVPILVARLKQISLHIITQPLTAAQSYNSKIPGYENLRFYCPHCHNVAVEAIKQRSFFTLCWVPLIPLGWGKKLHCTICNWSQDTNDSALANMAQQQQARR
jgi:predicted RNA-binding Zn-ribbon protein involved in translation (DUF1610 family)